MISNVNFSPKFPLFGCNSIRLDNIEKDTHNKAKTYYVNCIDTGLERKFAMSNITLSVDDEIIKKVRKIAIDRNTTLTAMVRDFLTSVATRDAQKKNEAIRKLRRSFNTISRDMGRRKWTREALHER